MIPASCKRLIEVDFPIGVVSEHSAREKSIRHGHPSTLHLWWARRPLAACRAVLMGLLLPDPCDKDCPADFKPQARDLLSKRYTFAKNSDDSELRELLLQFIGELANWDNSSNSLYLEIARGLVKAAHPEETPLVVDPFSGGGSIPLEALRLGCEAFASDLNPVACLILKTLLEDIPKYGNADFVLPPCLPDSEENSIRKAGKQEEPVRVHGLANALRHVGMLIRKSTAKHLAEFYPPDPDGSLPIAYLWARTVRCEGVGCGAEIPLIRSFWLSKRRNGKYALRYRVLEHNGKPFSIKLELFQPTNEDQVQSGTVGGGKAICPCCQTVMPAARVQAQITAQRGGADVQFSSSGERVGGATLLAVVVQRVGEGSRQYRLATVRDYAAVYSAQLAIARLPKGTVPDEVINPIRPSPNARGLSAVTRYGANEFQNLFTARQSMGLLTTANAIRPLSTYTGAENALSELAGLALSRLADISNALCSWKPSMTQVIHLFTRQALPMVWDFAEASFLGDSAGDLAITIGNMARVVDSVSLCNKAGRVEQADAAVSPLPDESVGVWFTDPPYYDSIPYADLSDFFFVWLRRVLPNHPLLNHQCAPDTGLTPKQEECVWNQSYVVDGRPKDGAFFEAAISGAFRQGRRILKTDGISCVVFAHKTTEGWEALLSGLLRAGFVITASWPITTEMANRSVARDTAALAGSVHLVCRPRPASAGVGDWSEVKTAMEKRIREWLPTLSKHGVRGADAVFSCLGPALESYSRYDKVLTAADHEVSLGGDPEATEPHKRGFLAYVFEAVSKEALRQVLGDAETDGFEEDSRMTALFLWTLQGSKTDGKKVSTEEADSDDEDASDADDAEAKPKKAKAGFSMPFDTFIRITRPMGIHYPNLEGRVIEIEKGIVRLLPVRERSEQLLGEAATRPNIEISLKDIRQMELALGLERQASATQLPTGRKKGGKKAVTTVGGTEMPFTTLDRIHRAMLLFTLGRSVLLRQVLEEDMRQGKDFERLAMALNALYPDGCDERRMLEGVQAAMRGVR